MDNLFSGQKFDFIGEDYALKKTSDKNIMPLYRNGILIKEESLSPAIDKQLFVIDLVERQNANRTKLALALGISRQSINNWVITYRKYGSTRFN